MKKENEIVPIVIIRSYPFQAFGPMSRFWIKLKYHLGGLEQAFCWLQKDIGSRLNLKCISTMRAPIQNKSMTYVACMCMFIDHVIRVKYVKLASKTRGVYFDFGKVSHLWHTFSQARMRVRPMVYECIRINHKWFYHMIASANGLGI